MEIENVTVAGGGVLGSQIAMQVAYCGFKVCIFDCVKPQLERLRDIYVDTLEAMKTNPAAYCRGLTTETNLSDVQIDELKAKAVAAYESIKLTTSYEEAAKDVDIVIEAISEKPKQKIGFYLKLAQHLPEKTIILTNSSTLLPSTLAKYTGRPEKYMALHFASEVWRNNISEVMGHTGTDPEVYKEVVKFATDIKMIPLQLKKEQPGYILNSMLVPFLYSAQDLFVNGVADPDTIDKAWTLGTGAPLGPFHLIDSIGLNTTYNIVSLHPKAQDPKSSLGRIAAMLKSYIDQGKTGVNAGEGFYKYD